MANEEQLSILKQGVEVWNKWRNEHFRIGVDLTNADLIGAKLSEVNLSGASLMAANLPGADLHGASLANADLNGANLTGVDLTNADLTGASLGGTNFEQAEFEGVNLADSRIFYTMLGNIDLSSSLGLESVQHDAPSTLGTNTIRKSKGQLPLSFLRGCGLSDWEIEMVKLYDPDLSNEEISNIQYRIFELRATQSLQISPLFISYSHADTGFVDEIGDHLTQKGIRYWRDIHDMKAGRMEKQIDRAIELNPTVLLILSKHSLKSDWVEHEVRAARDLEKEMGRDVLCPVALDDSWKTSPWPKRVMEQIMEYNILDFSEWRDDSKFDSMFRKLIDGLELFYKG